MPEREITIIKTTGEREPWDEKKLERSLLSAKANKEVAEEIVRHIKKDLRDGMSTSDIYEHAFSLLKQYDRPVAAKYSLKRAIMQLGPSGFPFERFVAEILKKAGYHTRVGVMVQGACVEHEVDIVAERSGERILVEAKYHNSADIRTDVKVALYVHARFQDIQKRLESNGADDSFTQAWLITNTSFTSQAIKYGTCAGLSLTGWNHPKGRTLEDLIEETQTHPVTCLTTLTDQHKDLLLNEGVVLCRDIISDPDRLKKIGINKARIDSVLEEGTRLCPLA